MTDTPVANTLEQTQEVESFNEYEAIVEALKPYTDGARTGDGSSMRKAFFDHAHVVGSFQGSAINLNADEFVDVVSQGGASPAVKSRIVWIDISGPAAAARVEFLDWGGARYTDFFVLYKQEGQWKISGKVYNSYSRN